LFICLSHSYIMSTRLSIQKQFKNQQHSIIIHILTKYYFKKLKRGHPSLGCINNENSNIHKYKQCHCQMVPDKCSVTADTVITTEQRFWKNYLTISCTISTLRHLLMFMVICLKLEYGKNL